MTDAAETMEAWAQRDMQLYRVWRQACARARDKAKQGLPSWRERSDAKLLHNAWHQCRDERLAAGGAKITHYAFSEDDALRLDAKVERHRMLQRERQRRYRESHPATPKSISQGGEPSELHKIIILHDPVAMANAPDMDLRPDGYTFGGTKGDKRRGG
jgi:hypothetical protein